MVEPPAVAVTAQAPLTAGVVAEGLGREVGVGRVGGVRLGEDEETDGEAEARGEAKARGEAVTVVPNVTVPPAAPGAVGVPLTAPGLGLPEAGADGDEAATVAVAAGQDRGDDASAWLAEMLWEHAASDPTITAATGRAARLIPAPP
jgi:hypothetical protein